MNESPDCCINSKYTLDFLQDNLHTSTKSCTFAADFLIYIV